MKSSSPEHELQMTLLPTVSKLQRHKFPGPPQFGCATLKWSKQLSSLPAKVSLAPTKFFPSELTVCSLQQRHAAQTCLLATCCQQVSKACPDSPSHTCMSKHWAYWESSVLAAQSSLDQPKTQPLSTLPLLFPTFLSPEHCTGSQEPGTHSWGFQ